MSLSPEIVSQIFSLPAQERYELANQLLDSVDEAVGNADPDMSAELQRRREEILRGESIVPDWRLALTEIENSLGSEKHG
jgi:hypothetical protein